jgi:phthalate 4,5-dioxygenase oxygenase subunit
MLSAEQNDLITRTSPGTAAGTLMRRYWQPAALVDELAGNRPVKPVRLMGEDLVAFRDDKGRYGLLGRHCPHRGTDLAYGRLEDGGLRCAFHGWLLDVDGTCLQTPAEPETSNLCANIKQKTYPGSLKRAASCSPISARASRQHFRNSIASSRRRRTPSPLRA